MVNGRLTEKPAVLLSAPLRWRIAVGSLFGFRSGVLPGGIMRPDVSPLFGRRYGGLGNGGGGDLVKAIVKKGLQLFPERQLLLRSEGRVRYITLSRWLQMSVAAGGLAGFALISYAAVSLSGERPAEISQGATSGIDLQTQIDQLQQRLAAANSQLAQIEASATAADVTAADSSRAETEASIKRLEEARDRAIAEREELQRQLAAAQETASDKSDLTSRLPIRRAPRPRQASNASRRPVTAPSPSARSCNASLPRRRKRPATNRRIWASSPRRSKPIAANYANPMPSAPRCKTGCINSKRISKAPTRAPANTRRIWRASSASFSNSRPSTTRRSPSATACRRRSRSFNQSSPRERSSCRQRSISAARRTIPSRRRAPSPTARPSSAATMAAISSGSSLRRASMSRSCSGD